MVGMVMGGVVSRLDEFHDFLQILRSPDAVDSYIAQIKASAAEHDARSKAADVAETASKERIAKEVEIRKREADAAVAEIYQRARDKEFIGNNYHEAKVKEGDAIRNEALQWAEQSKLATEKLVADARNEAASQIAAAKTEIERIIVEGKAAADVYAEAMRVAQASLDARTAEIDARQAEIDAATAHMAALMKGRMIGS